MKTIDNELVKVIVSFEGIKGIKDIEKINKLIKRGADINVKDQRGRTLLHEAVHYSDVNMIEFLIKNNANVNAKEEIYRESALHEAAYRLDLQVMELLLKAGANIDGINKFERTPLNVAVRFFLFNNSTTDGIQLLLKHGASIDNINSTNTEIADLLNAARLADSCRQKSIDIENLAQVVKDFDHNTAEVFFARLQHNLTHKKYDSVTEFQNATKGMYDVFNYISKFLPTKISNELSKIFEKLCGKDSDVLTLKNLALMAVVWSEELEEFEGLKNGLELLPKSLVRIEIPVQPIEATGLDMKTEID